MEFRRKLYRRGSSFETTIPKPMLFDVDVGKRQNVIFSYDRSLKAWTVRFEEQQPEMRGKMPGNMPRKALRKKGSKKRQRGG